MTRDRLQIALLLLCGALALAIGAGLTFAPVAFAASNGITLDPSASALSEARAPGGALLALGAFMLAGAWRADLRPAASWVAAGVYLPYGLARLVGLVLDGLPGPGLLVALGLELALGALALAAARTSPAGARLQAS